MQFTKRLRGPIERGEITISIRIWQRPHVRAGNKYRLGAGCVVVDLLKVAKHGPGENVYLVEFHYEPARRQ